MAITAFAFILVATSSVFHAVLTAWSGEEHRTGIGIELDRAAEEMTRELRAVSDVKSDAGQEEVRFERSPGDAYIYYFYNAADVYARPPVFDQKIYQLRRTALKDGIDGNFVYGSGDILAHDILPPPVSHLSVADGLVTLDLCAKKNDESVRSRTRVRPRNS
jgi:hypothetical protein